jgi:5-formyltetrahydrofolate cyclo-ligase
LSVQKKALRDELRQRLSAIPEEELARRSAAACRLLCEQPVYARAEVVMIFLSTPIEVDTRQLALQAWGDHKRVVAPRVSWDQRRMLPIELSSLNSATEYDGMGIRGAVEGIPVPIADVNLVVVPGLAFDDQGNRLGRGRGFYDRFLSHPDFRGVSCGLGFEDQMVDRIPVGEHDVCIRMLVTESQVRRFKP